MKLKYMTLIFTTASLLLAGCEYDNFEEPKATLSGKVVYQGNAVSVRNNGPQLELWQDGFALRSPITVNISQDGSYSAILFNGRYKMVRRADAPWQQQASDTLIVNVSGNTTFDVPVNPYFTISNDTFGKSGNNVTAKFVLNKIIPSANLELVRLYLGKSILTDQVQREFLVDGNVGSIVPGQPSEITASLPDNLKDLDYIFARIGVKSTSAGEYYYTQVQKIALK
jgi:hypothetical protein